MFRVAVLFNAREVRQFDGEHRVGTQRLHHIGDVDRALADIIAGVASRVDERLLIVTRGDLRRAVAYMGHVEELLRAGGEFFDGDLRAPGVERVHHQARVRALHRIEKLKRAAEVPYTGPGYEFKVHRQPVLRREVAERGELLRVIFLVVGPDAADHALRAKRGSRFKGRLVALDVDAVDDARKLYVMYRDPGLAERLFERLIALAPERDAEIPFALDPHIDVADADVIISDERGVIGHLHGRPAEDGEMSERILMCHDFSSYNI